MESIWAPSLVVLFFGACTSWLNGQAFPVPLVCIPRSNILFVTRLCYATWSAAGRQIVTLLCIHVQWITVYPKKYAHGFCFAVLCCGYTLSDFPISTRLTSLALWQSDDCPSASKATLMNMDKYLIWIHYERLHNHNKAKHNKTVCIFIGIYCIWWEIHDFECSLPPTFVSDCVHSWTSLGTQLFWVWKHQWGTKTHVQWHKVYWYSDCQYCVHVTRHSQVG